MLNASIEIVKGEDARGVYEDPNYLNSKSQSVISKQFDIIGFTDGITSGPENEQILYLSYYHSLKSTPLSRCDIQVDFGGRDKDVSLDAMLRAFQNVGQLSKYKLAYNGEVKLVYVLNDKVVRKT